MVCCVLFLSVIYDNQKKIREECHVHKLPRSYNQVSSPCDHSVADPDLQIMGMGGHPDPEKRGRAGLKKNCFQPFRPQFGLRIKGGPRPPGPLPWIYHCDHLGETSFELWLKLKFS